MIQGAAAQQEVEGLKEGGQTDQGWGEEEEESTPLPAGRERRGSGRLERSSRVFSLRPPSTHWCAQEVNTELWH